MKFANKVNASLIVSALAISGAIAQNPEFKHLKSIPLGTLFDGANTLGVGTDAADVAFDGVNAYVVGYATGASGSSGTHGVVKIDNLLGNHNVGASALLQVAGAGNNGMSMIEFTNNALYVGTGLMINNSEALCGIRKFDTSGNLDVTWAGDGKVSPADCSSSTRLDAISVDPGWGGSPVSIGVVARSRGFLFRRDVLNGFDNGNAQWASVINSNTWRDVAFDANGNTWYRAQNDVLYAERIFANGNPSFNPMVSVIDNASQENVNQNVAYVPGNGNLFGSFLCYNNRSSGQNFVNVVSPTGTAILQLNGAEGGIGTAFTNTLLNFKGIEVNGKSYLLVVNASASDRLEVYAVGRYATVSGYTVLEGEEFNGGLNNLLASDDTYVAVFNDPTTLAAKVQVTATAPVASANRVEVSVESSVDRPGLSLGVFLYNFASGSPVFLAGTTATTTDSVISAGRDNPAEFMPPGIDMRVQLTWAPINDEDPSQDGWLHKIDNVQVFLQ